MIVGADIDAIVTSGRTATAQTQTGHSIQFWGRYFKEAGNSDPAQYQPNQEAALFNGRGIRVLPIGRQTNHVDRTESVGRADGKIQAGGVIAGFGAAVISALPQGLLVFVDVEGPPHESLSEEYYTGWS